MDCFNKKRNLNSCNCTYDPCSRKRMCCECLHYHRQMDQLPACFFNKEDEQTYDRSIRRFLNSRK
ncbi:MAG: DUF6485 family protein [Candidatus Omnitrophica bacterium]|nr:DUF6485 family protein [Candidatus Omnitrophota bacterium]